MAENRTLTGERLANNKAEYRHIEGFGAREPAARDWFNHIACERGLQYPEFYTGKRSSATIDPDWVDPAPYSFADIREFATASSARGG